MLSLALVVRECQSMSSALDERSARLLEAVIDFYIESAEPVGSGALLERYPFEVSSATIRNWFADLEEKGYLLQPHTSGGRIPTEQAFRWYVSRVRPEKPSKKWQSAFEQLAKEEDRARQARLFGKMLAEGSGVAAFVSFAPYDSYYTGLSQLFAQPEFKDWQRVVSLSEVLDRLDDALLQMRTRTHEEPTILIGTDSPFGPLCSALVYTHNDWLYGVLGPLRLPYARALGCLFTLHDLAV